MRYLRMSLSVLPFGVGASAQFPDFLKRL